MSLPVDFALEYAARGWVVIPLRQGDNKPHGMLGNGWNFGWVGSTDPDTIRRWWTASPWYRWWEGWRWVGGEEVTVPPGWVDGDPLANVGVVNGARSRLLVIDVDTKGDPDGWDSLRAWGMLEELPVTRRSRTTSLGTHIWFELPKDRDVRRRAPWLPNVDACGSGGLTAAPPSFKVVPISDPRGWAPPTAVMRQYEWEDETVPLATAPEWLLQDIETRTVERRGVAGSGGGGSTLPPTDDFLERGFGITGSGRNKDCYRLAWRLWSKGLSEHEVTAVIARVVAVTTPIDQHGRYDPFTWGEAHTTTRSAERAWRNTREAEQRLARQMLEAWQSE